MLHKAGGDDLNENATHITFEIANMSKIVNMLLCILHFDINGFSVLFVKRKLTGNLMKLSKFGGCFHLCTL